MTYIWKTIKLYYNFTIHCNSFSVTFKYYSKSYFESHMIQSREVMLNPRIFPWFQDITNDIFSRLLWLESWSIEHVIPRRNIQSVTCENRHHSYIAMAGPAWLQSVLAQESGNAWYKSTVVLISVFLYWRVHPVSSHVLSFWLIQLLYSKLCFGLWNYWKC